MSNIDLSCLEKPEHKDGQPFWHMGQMQELLEAHGVSKDVAARVISYSFLNGWRGAEKAASKIIDLAATPRLAWPLWSALCAEVYERDGLACTYCGSDGPLCVDHIHPLSRQGTNDVDNLTVACVSCNTSKGRKLLSEWKGRGGSRNQLPGEQCP